MYHVQSEHCFTLRLLRGEPVFDTLVDFCESHRLTSGFVTGIGAVENIELGYYQLDSKTYIRKRFEEEAELLGMQGNFCMLDGRPFFHIHAAFGGPDFNCFGGHVFEATVAATVEVQLQATNTDLTRRMDDGIGLKLLDFSHCGL